MAEEIIPQIAVAESEVIGKLGEKAWNKLQASTRIDIITSEICLCSFRGYEKGFDFSSVITPAMKGLEQELRISFYDGYLVYLETGKYSPEQYAHRIWKGKYPGDFVIAKKRSTILDYNGERLLYKKDRSHFTIGDFRFTIGANCLDRINVDCTFEEYCKEALFHGCSFNKDEFMDWICKLVIEVESLRRLRNDSAHAGKILNQNDAETALNELVKVKKILGLIVCPPWIA